jgi:hypothetical protein
MNYFKSLMRKCKRYNNVQLSVNQRNEQKVMLALKFHKCRSKIKQR